jgi:hypothetical protein
LYPYPQNLFVVVVVLNHVDCLFDISQN